jgi:bifunctional non-homologous end joining protein LigD
VFLDYNQNAKDRTIASAYSVRPTTDARVSAPLTWEEIDECNPADFTLKTMPARFAQLGDRHAGIDEHPCSIEWLLELSAKQEREGQGDAPWPPHYRKQAGEPARVQPSKRRTSTGPPKLEERRRKYPLLEIGRAPDKDAALAGLERWKQRHPDAASHLEPADVLVDAMRGRFRTWTRIRVNLQHVPESLRPEQEPLDPDDTPNEWANVDPAAWHGRPSRPRKARKTEPDV